MDAGLRRAGIGVGGRAELLGVGTGGSFGVGQKGPDLGASVAFGQIGTLRLGSHALRSSPQTYPGAAAGYNGLQPGWGGVYYAPRQCGTAPYYPPAPLAAPDLSCPAGWTCP